MKNQRVARSAVLPCLAAMLPTALIGAALAVTAPGAATTRAAHALHTLTSHVRAVLAPQPAAVQLADYTGGGSGSLLRLDGSVFAAQSRVAHPRAAQPRAAGTGNPVSLQAYGIGEVVHITNAAGQVVRAPQSATDTSIAPNQPLTFTVRVNNSTASTQATAVYIQIKDPDSIYDDVNNHGNPREHKVFAEDSYTYKFLPSLNHPDKGYVTSSGTYYGDPGNTSENPSRAATPPQTPTGTGLPPAMGIPPSYFGSTPADDVLDPEQDTSGTASREIFNGFGSNGGFYDNFYELPYQAFPQTQGGNLDYHQRGTIGGRDPSNPSTQFITLGHLDAAALNTVNPIFQDGPNNSRVRLPGPDPGDQDNPNAEYTTTSGTRIPDYGGFRTVGQEYECQYLNPHDANPDPTALFSASNSVSGFPTSGSDAADSDYGDPYFLAGVDDQNGYQPPRSEWLALHPVAAGSDLYSATWAPPNSPSDFYMDVIVYDNQNTFRIYDNVWGFSTLPFQANNDILLVIDNALGQKYAASALSNTGGLQNLRPTFYGAESSFTATDVTRLPNATIKFVGATNPSSIFLPPYTPTLAKPVGMNPPTNAVNSKGGYPVISLLGYSPFTTSSPQTPQNGLGYHSYGDGSADDNDVILSRNTQVTETGTYQSDDTSIFDVSVPQSQAYSLWRILCRGRVSAALLQNPPHPANSSTPSGYAPDGLVTQPAVSDPTTGFSSPSAVFPVASRCVVWVSPFTGDQPLEVPGSLDDTATQTQLQQFVAAGGRLFITGQEVATALRNEGAAPFLNNVLNASLVSDGSGTNGAADNQTLAGQNSIGHFLSFDSLFDFQAPFTFDDVYSGFFEQTSGFVDPYVAPAGAPLLINNNYAENIDPATYDKWRTDASLTQEGPYVQSFGNASVQSRISTIMTLNGATADFSIGSNASMIWHTDSTDAQGSGFGSRVVFASFGLEGLGNDYYHKVSGSTDEYFPRNQRARVLHNIVSYLRTGTFSGTIFLGTGTSTGVAGATVYLIPLPNASASHTIPNQTRQAYSAITSNGTDGNPIGYYNIQGVVPGGYRVIVYKNGFSHDESPLDNPSGDTFAVYGDTTDSINLNISQLPPGHITGTVKFSDGTAAPVGTPVTFVSTDGTTTAAGQTTDTNGDYTVSVPVGTYNGTATTTTPPATGTVSNIAVATNPDGTSGTATANFVLQLRPSTISGTVTNGGVGVPATVSFTSGSGSTTSTTSVQTASNGTYTSPGLASGTYTVTASATINGGFYVGQASSTVTLTPGDVVTGVNIALQLAQNATLSGTVTDNTTSHAPINNVTVTVTRGSGSNAVTVATVTTGSAGTYSTTVPQGVYTVTASATGYVTQTQTLSIPIGQTTATLNFTLAVAPSLTAGLSAGHYNMVSWPYEDDTPLPGSTSVFTDIFGSLISPANPNGNRGRAMIYDSGGLFQSARASYVAEPAIPADALHLGRGYFVYIQNLKPQFTLLGTPPAGATVSVALQGGNGLDGWNMIGVPSTTPISVSNLHFQIGSVNAKYSDAVGAGYIYPTVYAYSPGSNSYVSVTQMQRFQGYWIHAKISGLTILIPTGGG